MTVDEFKKLKKLMQLTQSDNDNEALAALRKANAIIKSTSADWERILSRTIVVVDEVEEAPPPPRPGAMSVEIDDAFEICLAGTQSEFIDSLYDQWHATRFLSPRQTEALFKWRDNIRRRA